MGKVSIHEFEREYLKVLREKNAAIFGGAGLSSSSGYVNWKELMRELASDINLDVDKEDDLIGVAQYYYNEKGRNRSRLSQKLLEEFTQRAKQNENLEILSKLPIEIYWTTNYDSLIESTLHNYANKKVDVKKTSKNLSNTLPGRDAIVYKMHGDIEIPEETVLIRDDYELYNEKRQLFTINLQGDLVSKTFLFIGFSFEDPNLMYILSRIRVLLGENNRTHYCFFKEIEKINYDNKEDYIYEKTKQDLQVQDLGRYGISAVMVKDYDEITKSLRRIQNKYKLKYILISGSAEEYGEFSKEEACSFTYELSSNLIKEDYKIITGFGEGIGSYVIAGAIDEIYKNKHGHIDNYLTPRPFPFLQLEKRDKDELNKEYRKNLIADCGVAIFIFGNKINENTKENENAGGVWEEFEMADNMGKVVIPIGSTGYMAREIWETINSKLEKYNYLTESMDVLKTEINPQKLVAEINKILKKV